MKNCEVAGHKIYIPEVIDYELRRELIRAQKTTSIAKLDRLKAVLRFLPINSDAMRLAADLWAKSRQSGLPTGDPKKLDIDVILAAQALTLPVSHNSLIVATSNVSHLARFVPAELWNSIAPKSFWEGYGNAKARLRGSSGSRHHRPCRRIFVCSAGGSGRSDRRQGLR